MVPFAVIDLWADDWFQSRQESARRFGTKPSRIATWFAARGQRAAEPPAVASSTTISPAGGESKRAA